MVKIVKKTQVIGRPTKYNPQIIYPKVKKYISSCSNQIGELPSVEGLALALDVHVDTLYEWSTKYPPFSEAIKKILTKQKKKLMDDGLYKKGANAIMAIFLLKVNHGMKDSAPIAIQINNITPEQLKDEQLNAIIA